METATDPTRPTIDERYTSASNTDDLTMDVQVQATQPADVLIAAGWSRSRLGAALQRLHSEWDGAEKPRKPTQLQIDALAAVWPRAKIPSSEFPLVLSEREMSRRRVAEEKGIPAKAARQAHDWWVHELGLLFQKLKTLPEVRERLERWARQQGIEDEKAKVAQVLSFWLDHTCRTCGGARWEVIPGTNRQSNRLCQACKGSGEMQLPHGLDGRRIEREINTSVRASADSMAAKLRRYHRPARKSD
jgi:hypothetical protein